MLSKILTLGDKIELSKARTIKTEDQITETKRVFISQVLDIIDEDRLKIGMPMEGGNIVTLSINSRIDACFYTKGGLYQSRLIVKDRYKEGSVFILVVELTTELIKYQRRQYFRLGCTIDINYKDISKEEYEILLNSQTFDDKLLELDGVVLDISGGGMRFVSGKRLLKEQIIMINLEVSYGNNNNKYSLFGKIITSNEIPNRNGMFEHRVEYLNMNGGTREALIRYIFEEERRQRQREKD
jgi:c-di-GMP-binding flagellar brake protein YcgR